MGLVIIVFHWNAQSSAPLQDWKPSHMYPTALYNKVAAYREIFVDFAGGCTGAARQVSHWVTRARSSASRSFPQPRGAPHGDLLIKMHMCQRSPNPSESYFSVSLYVVAVVTAGNKLWQTHNFTERGSSENDSCFLSLTLSNMLALMAK